LRARRRPDREFPLYNYYGTIHCAGLDLVTGHEKREDLARE
jgi:hypothetical protein